MISCMDCQLCLSPSDIMAVDTRETTGQTVLETIREDDVQVATPIIKTNAIKVIPRINLLFFSIRNTYLLET